MIEESDYRRHGYLSKEDVRAAVYREVERLLALDDATSPETPGSEYDKDQKANQAIGVAAWISRILAGWAFAHQLGVIEAGQSRLPLYPSALRSTSEYRSKKELVDTHSHEIRGAELIRSNADTSPRTQRLVLLDFLRAGGGGLPIQIVADLQRAVEMIANGEVAPIFSPERTYGKVSLKRLDLQLSAMRYVAFQKALGMTAMAAMNDIATAYDVKFDTVRGWPKQVRDKMGSLCVSAAELGARNQAISYKVTKDPLFLPDLKMLGDEYRALASDEKL